MSSDPYRRLEEAAFNAWPALQTILVDGWVLRFAGGYTKRANSINPTYPAAESDLALAMDRCEAIFQRRGQPSIVRLTSFGAPEGLDDLLVERGYAHADLSVVMTRELTNPSSKLPTGLVMEATDPDTWLNHYEAFTGAPISRRATHRQMLDQISGPCLFATLVDPSLGRAVACGLAVCENELVGLFEIATDENLRRRGYGRSLVDLMTEWATDLGATTAYLQVTAKNDPARRLYAQLGFVDAYTYWYRIPAPA